MVYLACQQAIKMIVMWYDRVISSSEWFKWLDLWYVSNVSIIFDCSMLLYYLFWMLMGFVLHFYIIFGTNLLIGGPTQIVVFLPILEFQRKRISNGVQTEWNLRERDFQNKRDPEDLEWTSSNQHGGHGTTTSKKRYYRECLRYYRFEEQLLPHALVQQH